MSGPRAGTERSSGDAEARRYESPLRTKRAAETRAALIAAAHRLFVDRGWAGAGMRDIAHQAGVATETVYAYFSSKRGLFQAVVDVAVTGDDLPLAVAERPEFDALGEGAHARRTAAAARLLTGIYSRTAAFANVMREAAANDSQIDDMLRATRERQRRDVAAGAALIMGRDPTTIERDGMWAITSPEIYLLLVEESSWTSEQYQAWMATTLERLLPHASSGGKPT